MKEKFSSFFKPRLWTVLFSVLLLFWQYVYAYRGVDIEVLSQVRTYFGAGLTTINWDNFLIRTLSLGAIWIVVALLIFALLWMAETFSINSHNRKVAKKYVNQPKEDYQHLLRVKKIRLISHFVSFLWLSAGMVLVGVGILMIPEIVESVRNFFVYSYLSAAYESGDVIEYNNTSLLVGSFLACYPFWYLYAAADTFCFLSGRKKQAEADLEENHFAVSIVDVPEIDEDADEEEDSGNGSNFPQGHVI